MDPRSQDRLEATDHGPYERNLNTIALRYCLLVNFFKQEIKCLECCFRNSINYYYYRLV